MQQVLRALENWRAAERGRFALWMPVFMGTGVLSYFSLRSEPPVWLGGAATVGALCLVLLLARHPVPRALAMASVATALGLASAQVATFRAPPAAVLPSHAAVLSGVVRSVEALPNGQRITLDSARINDEPPLARWVRLRLKKGDNPEINTGDTIRVRALLRPPAPPAYPGAWDLQRDAWFSGWAGSGYAIGPLERISADLPHRPLGLVQRLREYIARHITRAIPGPAGQICVTLLTGITTGIPPPDHDAFRASGLAHLLAVAGLHIGIVMGWMLTCARFALAASERASLRWPARQLAALIALAAGGGYMLLTGMHLPIVRSFAMACLYSLAVLAGRRPLSLRGLAVAATVLMLLEPEEVPGVSFQMSFGAVLALIAGYEALRPALRSLRGNEGSWRRPASVLVALALTSVLAGVASAPFGAYHFGRIQLYFVLANMVAVPLAALWVMPAGLLGLILLPLGLEWVAFVPMGWGAATILWVAHATADLPSSTMSVPHMPAWGLALVALGMAWLGLWRSLPRLAGIPVIVLGLASPWMVQPPDLLVSADARLIGIRVQNSVYLQQQSGASAFTRDAWLQYWAADAGEPFPVDGDAARGVISCQKDACLLRPLATAKAALLVRGATHPDGCAVISVIISAEPARGLCPRPWPALVDRFTVWRYGATAIWLHGQSAFVLTDRAYRGRRPWVPPPPTSHAKSAPTPTLPTAPVDD